MNKCILDSRRKTGCSTCNVLCSHRIAMHGLNGDGGRVGAAGAPKDYRYLTLENSPAKAGQAAIYAKLEKYVATFGRSVEPDGERIKSLYLWSENPGTGKTTTAVALMNEFIMSNYLGNLRFYRDKTPPQLPAMFFDLNAIQRTYNLASQADDKERIKEVTAKFDKAAKVPFLVLDDVGIRSATEAFKGMLHDIINYRATNSLPTIYTSNVSLDEFIRLYDARVYDRARDKCAEIHFQGESKRGK